MRQRNRGAVLLLFAFLAGLLSGAAAPELLRMGTGTYAGFFSLYSLEKYGTAAAGTAQTFFYVVSVRLRLLLFLWMSSCTAAGLLFHMACVWWLAASAAMLLGVFALREGGHGLLLFACCLFPQWILYGEAGRRELRFLFGRGAHAWQTDAPGVPSVRRRELLGLLQMTGICVAGCACEAFLGTWTGKVFLQILS